MLRCFHDVVAKIKNTPRPTVGKLYLYAMPAFSPGGVGLTPGPRTPQTNSMPHIYMRFDFGKDEEKAQLARHKLETWKQAFRLDKKLVYVLARAEDGDAAAEPVPSKAEKPKGKAKAKDAAETQASNEPVEILLRLAFSNHEKLTEQRWLDRIPAEEPFLAASPKVLKPGDAKFAETEKEFEELQEPKALVATGL